MDWRILFRTSFLRIRDTDSEVLLSLSLRGYRIHADNSSGNIRLEYMDGRIIGEFFHIIQADRLQRLVITHQWCFTPLIGFYQFFHGKIESTVAVFAVKNADLLSQGYR